MLTNLKLDMKQFGAKSSKDGYQHWERNIYHKVQVGKEARKKQIKKSDQEMRYYKLSN